MKRAFSIFASLAVFALTAGCVHGQQPVTPPVITYTCPTPGNGATWGGPATHTSADSVAVAVLNVGATAGGASTCEILSYASAVLEKHVTCVGNYFDATDGVEQVENFNGVWIVSSPAAITSIVLGVGTDDFGVGTVATLYGEQ